MNTSAGWKLFVVVLGGYSIFVTRKLLHLTDAAYSLAHEARFSSVDSNHSLDDTRWGAEAIGTLNMGMILVGLFLVTLVVVELVKSWKNATPAPTQPPPIDTAPPA